jgi:ABC-type hemin transport system substrate-binding protein
LRWLAICVLEIAERRGDMKKKWIIAGLIAALVLLGAAKAAAQSYNPIHWIRKGPTASEQLAANGEQSKKLASQLQALLPPRTKLEDACTAFRQLSECVAALHVSHNLKIKFNCLKWDVTGLKPASGNVSSCSVPESGKALSLAKAIQMLKPEADAKAEAKSAEKRAQEDIKDASS